MQDADKFNERNGAPVAWHAARIALLGSERATLIVALLPPLPTADLHIRVLASLAP